MSVYDRKIVTDYMGISLLTLNKYLESAQLKLDCDNFLHLCLTYDRWSRQRTTVNLTPDYKEPHDTRHNR